MRGEFIPGSDAAACGPGEDEGMEPRPFSFRSPRRFRLAGIAAFAGAALLLSGCSVQEVTHTVNGEDVTDAERPLAADEVDACTALSDETLEALGLAELEPVELTTADAPGCDWSGINNYTTPSLVVWVTEPETPSENDEIVTIDGVDVNVWSIAGNSGRYVAYFDDVTLSVNYLGAELDIDAHDALELAMRDVLAHYGRS